MKSTWDNLKEEWKKMEAIASQGNKTNMKSEEENH